MNQQLGRAYFQLGRSSKTSWVRQPLRWDGGMDSIDTEFEGKGKSVISEEEELFEEIPSLNTM